MQLLIKHDVTSNLTLPLAYHHILQAIIYNGLDSSYGYSEHIHNEGYNFGQRQFRMFTFSLLQGRYEIHDKKISFRDSVQFEVRSPDVYMIKTLGDNIATEGIRYLDQVYENVDVYYSDSTIEQDRIMIKMVSPISIYTTDPMTNKTTFYSPDDDEFVPLVNDNFIRKYQACYGVLPESGVMIVPYNVTRRDKYVTKYKDFYISGWLGEYELIGQRKYLDFLYQAGLGVKNSQGFGMFDISGGDLIE